MNCVSPPYCTANLTSYVNPPILDETMDLRSNTVVITVECLCKIHTFSTEISTSKLPLKCNVCHCDSCRHSTGALHVMETDLASVA